MSYFKVEEEYEVELTEQEIKIEWLACRMKCAYFVHNYVPIYDATAKAWINFFLWKEQYHALSTLTDHQLIVILKARQLGMTWLCLAFILWRMIFHPQTTALIFSKRDDEAVYLLDWRLKKMYAGLPKWMQCRNVVKDSAHTWELSNGSIAYAFPTGAGDSYTASIALIDEADLVPDLDAQLSAVKPTIDGGGKLILLSRSDKDRPNSVFKNTFRGAQSGETKWKDIFLPWNVRPTRDATWYDDQKRDILARTGSLDTLWEQYPKTPEEALQPRILDKRFSPDWLKECFQDKVFSIPTEDIILEGSGAPAIPQLKIYQEPIPGHRYAIGCDPAEGNPNSHDSSAIIGDVDTGQHVATLSGRLQPATIAAHINEIGVYYNNAAVLVERNNHGHAVLLWLGEYSQLKVLSDDHWFDPKKKTKRPGWNDNTRGKTTIYNNAAIALRDKEIKFHGYKLFEQLSSIEGASLKAPKDMLDDEADAFCLWNTARLIVAARRRAGGWLSH